MKVQLHADGFVELYPVQAATWRITAGGHSRMHDVCISAPTGSGKTLAYALPIVQGLLRCAHVLLQANVCCSRHEMQVIEHARKASSR